MSIEQENVIDIISDGENSQEVLLAITDQLPWDPSSSFDHVSKLQKKINSYLAFLESGEIDEKYTQHRGKLPVIQVIGKYPLGDQEKEFYKQAAKIVENAGFALRFMVAPEAHFA